MSAQQVSILINAVDNATATLEKINGSVQKLGVQMQDASTKTEAMNTSMKNTGVSAKEAVYTFAALGTALMSLYYAYDRIGDAQRNIERANLRLDRSQKRLTDLMKDYDKACKDTTADVEKLARAELSRDKAKQGISKANDAVFDAQRELNIAIRETGSFSYATMKAQKDLQYAIENVDFAQREFGFAESDLSKTEAAKGPESEVALNLLEQIKLETDQVDLLTQMVDEMEQRKSEAWVTAIISIPLSLTTIIGSLAMIYTAIVGKGVGGIGGGLLGGGAKAAGGAGLGTSLLGASGAGGATATGILATAGGIGAAPLVAMGAATVGAAMIGGYGFAVQEQQRQLGLKLYAWEQGGEKGPVPEGATQTQIEAVRKEFATKNAVPQIANPLEAYNKASSEISALATTKFVTLPAKLQAQNTAFTDMANVLVGTSTKQSEVLSKMVGVETKFGLDTTQQTQFESIVKTKMAGLPKLERGGVIVKESLFLGGEKGKKEAVVPLDQYVVSPKEAAAGGGLGQIVTINNTFNCKIYNNQDIRQLAKEVSLVQGENLRKRK